MIYFRSKKKFLNDKRLFFLCVCFIALGVIITSRLFVLQIVRGGEYRKIASGQHNIYTKILPERGEIYAKAYSSETLYPVAANKTAYLVYVEPSTIQNKTKTASSLAGLLELDEAALLKILFKNDPYEPLAHYVPPATVEKIKALGLIGIGFEEEKKRVYPEKCFGGQVLGFLGYDGDTLGGKYGIEGYFNDDLSGQAGYLAGEKDALGRLIPWKRQDTGEAVDGSDLVLTIDRNVQSYICGAIEKAVEKFDAESGTVIVMEPLTGKILGLCAYPDYDPNNYSKVKDRSVFNIPAIFNQYEPGSIFKPFTMAAAIDSKLVSPETTYEDTGSVYIDPHTIKNSDGKANGTQTMIQVLEKSLNTGVVYVVKLLGAAKFRSYMEKFGFGRLTGVELNKEAMGDVYSLKKRGEIWSATASFGQGITVTPIQILNAFNAIINGGNLMKPFIVDKKIGGDGTQTEIEPQTIRRVISSRSSTLMRGMLASVVENGHGKRAGVAGYYVGGKTGTAQVPKKGGGYEEGKNIGSFVGFAPVDNPAFSMLVRLDNPKGVEWAESSAAPTFGEIAKYLLQYYKIAPER